MVSLFTFPITVIRQDNKVIFHMFCNAYIYPPQFLSETDDAVLDRGGGEGLAWVTTFPTILHALHSDLWERVRPMCPCIYKINGSFSLPFFVQQIHLCVFCRAKQQCDTSVRHCPYSGDDECLSTLCSVSGPCCQLSGLIALQPGSERQKDTLLMTEGHHNGANL